MTGETPLKEAIARLSKAMITLENAVDLRLQKEQEHAHSQVKTEIERMQPDLKIYEERTERLEKANKEASRRLVAAMETIRTVLDR